MSQEAVMKHLFGEMTWEEVNDAAQAGRVVLIPVAAIEQHGPHLPVDTDNVIGGAICNEAARRKPDLVVCAPMVHYGWNEHNMDFPGTISIRQENFLNYCYDIGESFARQGFERILYVNSHGSNNPLCDLIARRVTVYTTALAAHVNWWEIAWPKVMEVVEGGPKAVDHGCEMETSLYLYLNGDLVIKEKVVDEFPEDRGGPRWAYPNLGGTPVHFMNFWSRMSSSGVSGAPSLATAEKGEQIFQYAVKTLIEVASDFREMTVQPRVDYKVTGRARASGQAR
jgi:creatinine amidohydrolase